MPRAAASHSAPVGRRTAAERRSHAQNASASRAREPGGGVVGERVGRLRRRDLAAGRLEEPPDVGVGHRPAADEQRGSSRVRSSPGSPSS